MRDISSIALAGLVCLLISPVGWAEDGFPLRKEARIVFVGDIYLGSWAEDFIDKYGIDYPFRGCRELFREADLVVGNLEGPIASGGDAFPKEFNMRSPPGSEKSLAQANIRAVTLANNHILDYGAVGLEETFRNLESSNIRYFGAGMNRRAALEPAVLEIKGKSFAFLGFSATFPKEFWATDSTAGTAFPWREDLEEAIPRCDGEYDVVVASFHWGAELQDTAKDYQIELAHLCIDLGADLVVGHHPHIPQGVEIYRGVPILYSLGNFSFASYSENARVGLAAAVDFWQGNPVGVQVSPLNVYNAEVNFQPRLLGKSQTADYIRRLNILSQELNGGKIVLLSTGKLTF